jgi:hypothetical protein
VGILTFVYFYVNITSAGCESSEAVGGGPHMLTHQGSVSRGDVMADNIDALLEYLKPGTLAYQLVFLLRGRAANEWGSLVADFLRGRVAQEANSSDDATASAD